MGSLEWTKLNPIEIFGVITGIIYVFLEIRQNIWLWPVGIATSAVYVYVFFISKFYADMSLQIYYLVVSCAGWYWWVRGSGQKTPGSGRGGEDAIVEGNGRLRVTRLKLRTGLFLSAVFVALYFLVWLVLSRLTDSPVPEWDSLITSLSVIATWMLARKIFEHWYLWVVVNLISVIIFSTRELYPTVILYLVYLTMSFAGLRSWRKSLSG